MELNSFRSIHLARYRFSWAVTSILQLPPYASSTLRGVFGHALRHISCLTGANSCSGCPVLNNCPYPSLFEPHQLPRPKKMSAAIHGMATYAIEAPFLEESPGNTKNCKPGDIYSFDMVLMTPDAIRQLPLIIAAWKRAFSQGVGPKEGKAELKRIEHLTEGKSQDVYTFLSPKLQSHDTRILMPDFTRTEDVYLHFLTPLRISQRGALIQEKEITAGIFLRHLIRRVSFQLEAQSSVVLSLDEIRQLNALADLVQVSEIHMNWRDWSRYSNRQKQKMTLGGLVGDLKLSNVPPQLMPFIHLGQWLHLGKETAFGLGQYQWVH